MEMDITTFSLILPAAMGNLVSLKFESMARLCAVIVEQEETSGDVLQASCGAAALATQGIEKLFHHNGQYGSLRDSLVVHSSWLTN